MSPEGRSPEREPSEWRSPAREPLECRPSDGAPPNGAAPGPRPPEEPGSPAEAWSGVRKRSRPRVGPADETGREAGETGRATGETECETGETGRALGETGRAGAAGSPGAFPDSGT